MPEKAKRLAPLPETLRELFLKSGNLCAFPGCGRLMMNEAGTFVGQVCHIEAAEEGGERFNPAMTNEERRASANLMLMCYDHHVETDNVKKYTVELLQRYKRDHENRFSRPDRAILETLTDWTRLGEPTKARNLKRMNEVLGWNNGAQELQYSCDIVNGHSDKLKIVPIEVRRFLGAVAKRGYRAKDTNATALYGLGGDKVVVSDLRRALHLSEDAVFERASELETYGLGCIDELYQNEMMLPAVRIYRLDDWSFWFDLAEFCEKAPESMDAFTDDLDFARLDGEE